MSQHYTLDITIKALIDRVEALVDWAEVEIETLKPTNRQTIQRALSKALNLPSGVKLYVKPINPNPGASSSNFLVRFHDVTCYSQLERWLAGLGRHLALKPGFRIDKIEIACDVYCADPATQAAMLYRNLTRPVSDNRRLYCDFKGSGRCLPRTLEAIARHLGDGQQIGIGNSDDMRFQHIYMKTSDTIDGERREVEPRARIENRLSGSALPCQAPEQWRDFRFEQLAPWFSFTRDRDNLTPWAEAAMNASDQVGERKVRRHVRNGRVDGTRLHRSGVMADRELNDMMRRALINLSKRWKGTGNRRRPVGSTPLAESGKTDRNSALSDCFVENHDGGSNYYHIQPESITYQQPKQPTTTTQQSQPADLQPTSPRTQNGSSASASPVLNDQTVSALDWLMASYEASPTTQREHDRIDAIMREAVGEADPPPMNRSPRNLSNL